MASSTLIFCHYGNSNYLKFTLDCARKFNPEIRIILIGDKENKFLEKKINIEHVYFEDLPLTKELIHFEHVYKHIAGKKHGREYWTKFVFQRWFYVYSFVNSEKIDNFWHFDSDNLILCKLEEMENYFQQFDCTEQCQGICMNGFISNKNVVLEYLRKINSLFSDQDFLNTQLNEFETHEDWAFTEMRAYQEFKLSNQIKSVRLNTFYENGYFDECICNNDNFLTYEYKINSYNLKKIFVDRHYTLYGYHKSKQEYVKFNSLNMSWVPDKIIEQIYNLATRKKRVQFIRFFSLKKFTQLNLYS